MKTGPRGPFFCIGDVTCVRRFELIAPTPSFAIQSPSRVPGAAAVAARVRSLPWCSKTCF